MIIQHNIPAMNSHRNLGINNAQTAKNLEKLSSGYRINRAADDAAGLAISEKMRGQIRGLAMAEQNVKNGVSLIQTAEGALDETHAILQRMRELAVAAVNGTFQDEDRIQYTKEFENLKSEIDRIAESTHYNNIKLLDGSLGGNGKIPSLSTVTTTGTYAGTTVVQGTKSAASFAFASFDNLAEGEVFTLNYIDANGTQKTFSHTFTKDDVTKAGANGADFTAAIKAHFGNDFTVVSTFADGTTAGTTAKINAALTITANANGLESIVGLEAYVTGVNGNVRVAPIASTNTAGSNDSSSIDVATKRFLEIDGKKFQFVSDASQLEQGAEALFVATKDSVVKEDMVSIVAQLKEKGYNVSTALTAGAATGTILKFEATKGNGVVFQIGANGGQDQKVSLKVNNMSTTAIGTTSSAKSFLELTGPSLSSASIKDADSANAAIDIIAGATNMVSTQRAELGAVQNRLESTLNSLGSAKENLTSAEAVIRDVDMAKEMMAFTKNTILVQAAQAMLAQANQLPQGVLQLLR